MREADDQCAGERHFPGGVPGAVRYQQQGSGEDEHGADQQDVAFEEQVDVVHEEKPGDPRWDHRDGDHGQVACLLVPTEFKEPFEQVPDRFSEDDYRRQGGPDVEVDGKGQSGASFHVYSEGGFGQFQLSAGRHGQEFRQSLDDAQKDRLP